MATYYVRKTLAADGSDGPPDEAGFFYWFDGSDAAASDPNGVWTDETNADDMDISTVAYTTTSGSELTAQIKIEGTNAPSSGGTISTVDVWIYYGSGNVSTSSIVDVNTDGGAEDLTYQNMVEAAGWVKGPFALDTPTGGWTWAKVQSLEVNLFQSSGTSRLEIAAIGVMVHTTGEGQSTTNPYRSIDKAANAVAAGDTVYVGAGTYRESVTMDTSGSSGNQISFIADVDGSQTGDPGLVVISAFTDSNTATRTHCWDPDGRTFVTVRGFVMQGGTFAVVYSGNATNDNYEGVIFEDCVFDAGPDNADNGIYIDFNQATTPTNNGLTIRRCQILNGNAGIWLLFDQNATAEQNLKITIENCVLLGVGSNYGIWLDLVSSSTYGSGGVSINNCVIIGFNGVTVDHGASTTYPVAVRNCLIYAASNALTKSTSNDGALTSDYNTFQGSQSQVTAGANDRTETSTILLGGIHDLPLYRFLGWSPYKPFEPMRPNTDDDWSSVIGDASASFAPADDLYGNPRPMHGTADDRGAVEGRARPEQETTTVRTGTNALRFEGAGYHDFLVPVAAQSTTVSVYGRYDSNYSGTLPQLKVLNIPGVADQTDTMVAAANTWEELTATFTPTSAAVCRVRIISSDTSATGQSFFDDLTVG